MRHWWPCGFTPLVSRRILVIELPGRQITLNFSPEGEVTSNLPTSSRRASAGSIARRVSLRLIILENLLFSVVHYLGAIRLKPSVVKRYPIGSGHFLNNPICSMNHPSSDPPDATLPSAPTRTAWRALGP